VKKNGHEFFSHEKPDIICLQEIKCSKDKLPAEVKVYVNQEPVLKSTH
jgi:exonuclease III